MGSLHAYSIKDEVMKLASLYKEGHFNNSVYRLSDITHKYNPLSADIYLRNAMLKHGIELNTVDLNQSECVDFDIYIEARPPSRSLAKKILISMENPIHNKYGRNHAILDQFDIIFSWDKDFLASRENYFFSYIPHEMKVVRDDLFFKKRDKMICLINANKSFKQAVVGDLYKERYKLIKWFEKHQPSFFDLYGIGWNKPYPGVGFFQKQIRNYLKIKSKINGLPVFSSYRGEVDGKGIYLQYQFAICYENIAEYKYYITEKLLDAMCYGCIPIYWGAPNIQEVVPASCFIDRRDFSSTAELFKHLASLSEGDLHAIQLEIKKYMEGSGRSIFSYEATLDPIVDRIVELSAKI
jgi:hypothetical protein